MWIDAEPATEAHRHREEEEGSRRLLEDSRQPTGQTSSRARIKRIDWRLISKSNKTVARVDSHSGRHRPRVGETKSGTRSLSSYALQGRLEPRQRLSREGDSASRNKINESNKRIA